MDLTTLSRIYCCLNRHLHLNKLQTFFLVSISFLSFNISPYFVFVFYLHIPIGRIRTKEIMQIQQTQQQDSFF